MKPAHALVAAALWGCAVGAQAEELPVCYNYACATSAVIQLDTAQMARINMLFAWVDDAAEERQAIADAIGQIQVFAGEQTPTFRDRGRNQADDGVDGRMDCVDHSINNTAYLNMMKELGWLKFHQVLGPARRAPLFFIEHWAAHIAEEGTGREFAVDSWFFDSGHAALIFPLDEWLKGAEPDE